MAGPFGGSLLKAGSDRLLALLPALERGLVLQPITQREQQTADPRMRLPRPSLSIGLASLVLAPAGAA